MSAGTEKIDIIVSDIVKVNDLVTRSSFDAPMVVFCPPFPAARIRSSR